MKIKKRLILPDEQIFFSEIKNKKVRNIYESILIYCSSQKIYNYINSFIVLCNSQI